VIRAASTSRVRLTLVKRANGRPAAAAGEPADRFPEHAAFPNRDRLAYSYHRQTEAAKRDLHSPVLGGAAGEENLIGGKVAKRILDGEYRVGLPRRAFDLGLPGERPFTRQRADGGFRTGVVLAGREPFERPEPRRRNDVHVRRSAAMLLDRLAQAQLEGIPRPPAGRTRAAPPLRRHTRGGSSG
jgi:hypothetical protein